MNAVSTPHLQVLDWGLMEYGEALGLQEALAAERIADASGDCLVLVEHPPVVTIGRSGSGRDLRVCEEALRERGASVFRVDRGGMATFHGPGQLVAYPILKLVEKDLHLYLERLLAAVAAVLGGYGLKPEFKTGAPGVWVNGLKMASVGIASRRWVVYHGIALNVSTDLGWFDAIDPCGNPHETIGSMERELGRPLDMEEVKDRFVEAFCRIFEYRGRPALRRVAGERPPWLVLPAASPEAVQRMEALLGGLKLSTVCQSARCPNLGECFERGTATFMILGAVCTRRCRFCAVGKGSPEGVDEDEPERVARAVEMLGVRHAVVTSVTRDDLPDGGAGQFAKTVEAIRRRCPGVTVEVLIPDFQGAASALRRVCDARPEVLGHNLETVARLYPAVRPRARYRLSLRILEYASRQGLAAKSGVMLGLGETDREVLETMTDLKRTGCLRLTLGQYLPPSRNHLPVARYVSVEEFERWAAAARSMGFKSVASGPLVRSSYRAGEMVDTTARRVRPRESVQQ